MYLVVNQLPQGNQEMYDKIRSVVTQAVGGEQPDGGISHIAGRSDSGGWIVVDVWETEAHWQRFQKDILRPAFEQAGYGDRFDQIQRTTAEVAVLVPA